MLMGSIKCVFNMKKDNEAVDNIVQEDPERPAPGPPEKKKKQRFQ